MSEKEALQLVRDLLMDALGGEDTGSTHRVRSLSGRVGELTQAMRAAVTVIDRTDGVR
ncbi:hypothetical protein [Streptomyces sp. NBC_01803]|uniref:hypothetical protein n=1 Tax=Streptomyces sp. NBC_01803 TaxID=2975946 RepID=UPI002DDC5848|nr:hypothetical protein [Streptomyces sp. NBC_01803]WSA44964.1 hypothetical protein OIE51_12540 [Streptomyces sp. NBC_01803]